MNRPNASFRVGLLALASSAMLSIVSMAPDASAQSMQSIIRDPNPPRYAVEIEPHFNLQDDGFDYGAGGFGFGARFSIPVVSPGFVSSINDSIAISFGGDFIDYGSGPSICTGNICNGSPSFWALYAPVTMQWNFFLSDQWSVFGEPGVAVRHSFFSDCDTIGCPHENTITPAFYLGGRWHFSDTMALTMRLGAPTLFSIGISFMPSPTAGGRHPAPPP